MILNLIWLPWKLFNESTLLRNLFLMITHLLSLWGIFELRSLSISEWEFDFFHSRWIWSNVLWLDFLLDWNRIRERDFVFFLNFSLWVCRLWTATSLVGSCKLMTFFPDFVSGVSFFLSLNAVKGLHRLSFSQTLADIWNEDGLLNERVISDELRDELLNSFLCSGILAELCAIKLVVNASVKLLDFFEVSHGKVVVFGWWIPHHHLLKTFLIFDLNCRIRLPILLRKQVVWLPCALWALALLMKGDGFVDLNLDLVKIFKMLLNFWKNISDMSLGLCAHFKSRELKKRKDSKLIEIIICPLLNLVPSLWCRFLSSGFVSFLWLVALRFFDNFGYHPPILFFCPLSFNFFRERLGFHRICASLMWFWSLCKRRSSWGYATLLRSESCFLSSCHSRQVDILKRRLLVW